MAYVLGFFAADGCMSKNKRGAHFIEFQSIDKEIIYKIRDALKSNLKIGEYQSKHKNYSRRYSLQIGSKKIFNDLIKLGMTPNKSLTIKLPTIPEKYFQHFVRGYFDGDGNVFFGFFKKSNRKKKSSVFLNRFTAGSKLFLQNLQTKLNKLIFTNGSLYRSTDSWQLSYSTNDSKKLFKFMYNNNKIGKLIYLRRKYNIYRKAGVA